MVDDAGFMKFKSQTDKFRSFQRFQARFELDDSGKIEGVPHYLKQTTQVGRSLRGQAVNLAGPILKTKILGSSGISLPWVRTDSIMVSRG